MTLKGRIAMLEAAQSARELDCYARFLAERYHQPVADVRQELEAILARHQAGERPALSPKELQQAEELRQEVQAWETSQV
jgi:hypothetical protein